nr:hypothetical protein [Treponema sp.]
MNAMKNIKKPAYAVEMGQGMFAGVQFVCTNCGKRYSTNMSYPGPGAAGKCPVTGFDHIWSQL